MKLESGSVTREMCKQDYENLRLKSIGIYMRADRHKRIWDRTHKDHREEQREATGTYGTCYFSISRNSKSYGISIIWRNPSTFNDHKKAKANNGTGFQSIYRRPDKKTLVTPPTLLLSKAHDWEKQLFEMFEPEFVKLRRESKKLSRVSFQLNDYYTHCFSNNHEDLAWFSELKKHMHETYDIELNKLLHG